MSTLTRNNSHKKPQYKDYVSFLDSYRGSKKDDQNSVVTSDSGVNFSLNNSSNNSSCSVYSDVSDASTKNGFNDQLDNFNNRKYKVVIGPPKVKEPKQTVKTEMFIEIKNPPTAQSYPTQVFQVQATDNHQESTISVSSAAKIFEKKDETDSHRHRSSLSSLKPKQNSFKKTSIGEISKKFEGSSQTIVDSGKPPVKRATSIGEVSKIFETGVNVIQQNNTLHRRKNFNAVPKPFQPTTPVPELNVEIKTLSKPAILSPKPVIAAPTFPKFIPEPPRSYADSVDSALSSLSISPSPPQCASPPPGGPMALPPPPPPLPPANFTPKSSPSQKPSYNMPQPISVQVPQSNGPATPNGTLDRNDPRVKKAVYGALRNMYGAYHDQANDYLATLPKNRVRKNNGLDSIINSIAQARLPCVGAEFGHILPSNGYQPTVKLKPETTNIEMDPPPCVQNAMMTKDKKPFTYTPGGIDLSEVRSPRMQRRIERNANLGGASDMPKQPQPPPQNLGPLPPSALAVMRPQTQVQVFPGPPPPPAMQKNIPPPPPPPTAPLPTQKVTTNDNQVLERPDMTKIIPENPMALLRKTGGPSPRKSLVEQMYEDPPSPPQRNFEAQSPRYQPPVVERAAPVSPPVQQQRATQAYQPAPQQYQPPSPPQNQYQPSYQPSQPQYQPVQPTQPQYQPVQQRSTDSPKPSAYQPPIIERQPTIPRQEPPQKNVSSSVGSLYIPPLSQQQQKVASPPSPPERNQPQVQSPGTPTLKEAPRPWQQKNAQQQQELPPWAKKDEGEQAPSQSPPSAQQQRWQPQASQQQPPQQPLRQQPAAQQFSPRSPQVQPQSPRSPPTQNQPYPSNSFPVHIEIRTVPYQQEPEPSERNPNAVYVTQPVVLQHPGPGIAPPYQGQPKPQQQQQQQQQQYQQPRQQVQQQQPKVDSSGARIIPIQVEGRPAASTPGGERTLNRQLSWGSQPSQSNSFKVIQKITKTDDEEDDTPVTQHSARYPQEMPEQMRRMKVNDNGNFRQVPQQNNVGRIVPVQVEGNGQPQPYVHPSEQVVPEPKKYMGSNIPSRSFKMLQAMTAPSESCANANYNEELPFNPVFNPYSYPYYPPPYLPPDYYTNFYPQEQSEHVRGGDKVASAKSGRSTPLPQSMQYPQHYWHDYYPHNYPQEQSDSTSKMSDKSSKGSSKSGRSTPLHTAVPMPPPYWGYMPNPAPYARPRSTTPKPDNTLRPQTPKPTNDYQNAQVEEQFHYPMYPPYFDPYYYSYYYGYPPMIPPPYPYYPSSTENEEYSGYSSMDEMSNYNASRRSSLKRRNSLENSTNSVQALRQHFEVRSKSAAPRITITPTYSQEDVSFNVPPDKAKTELEDTDTEVEEEPSNHGTNLCRLRSIKSVPNINVYAAREEDTEDTDTETEESSNEETDEEEISVEQSGEEIIPHQLSVIYEESERGESRRSFRCNSVASEATTIAEHYSEEEEEDFLANQNVKYKINLFQESSETISSVKSLGGRHTNTFEQESFSFSYGSSSKAFQSNSRVFEDAISRVTVEEVESDDCREAIESKEDCDSSCKNKIEEVIEEKIANEIVEQTARESDDDWWGMIQNEDDTNASVAEKDSIIKTESVCDKVNSKADSVMIEANGEVVCVRLRNKTGSNRSSVLQESIVESNKDYEDSFFSTVTQRDSVYDILKNNEDDEEEIVSGGTLMRVDSFASQLEAIKRNSGLWDLDEISLSKPINVIKEESFESADSDEGENEDYRAVDSQEIVTTVEENVKSKEEIADHSEGSDEIDFWSQINTDGDDFSPRKTSNYLNDENATGNSGRNNDSTDSRDSSASKSHKQEESIEFESRCKTNIEYYSQDVEEAQDDSEESSETDSSEDEDDQLQQTNLQEQERNRRSNSRSRSLEPQTIKDRIEALRNSIAQKHRKLSDREEIPVSVKNKISAIEVPSESRSKTASTKSSIKSFEEYSEEEELDSGVISDISRHISDSEEFPELRKLTRYERAATHSRLFKLLQDECDIEEEEEDDEVFIKKEDKFSKLSVRQNRSDNKLSPSRSKLSLPLNKCNESDDEKRPQINEKLVQELVQSLLRSKKAQVFRNMPKDKLYAAAVTILQEGIDSGETPSEEFSSLLSPLRGDTESSTPAQTPQEFYGDYSEYKQYYDSWSDAAVEIMPSKAFKLLQEHLGANKLGTVEGILAKCPRILSSKNIPKEILRLLDESGSNSSDCSPTPAHTIPQSNDVTNT